MKIVKENVYEFSSRKKPTIHKIVADRFAKINDKPCWNPRQGHGSSLTFEFGEPHLIIEERNSKRSQYGKRRNATVRGEWHLWIYCCHWNISLEGRLAAHSESSREIIEIALAHLRGQILTKVSVTPRTGASSFEFDLGGRLETRRYEHFNDDGEPYPSWMFFDNQEHVLTYRADGKYAYQLSIKPTESWLK